MTKNTTAKAICFGEILWDMLPDGPQPGGAPMNVAYHLNKLGLSTDIISRIGNDGQGKKLSALLSHWGIQQDFLQIDISYPTSEVIASLNADHEVSYEILYPVAWDFISPMPNSIEMQADYLIFGSLAARNETSRNTLFELLETPATKVFDINLRPPFYNPELLEALLKKANIVKFNQGELELAASLFRSRSTGEQEDIHYLMDHFEIEELIVTKGAYGAAYYSSTTNFNVPGHPIRVQDTIGSGDSFLAAFIAGHAQQRSPQDSMQNAIAMGAFVATKKGGCPEYTKEEYIDFKNQIFNT